MEDFFIYLWRNLIYSDHQKFIGIAVNTETLIQNVQEIEDFNIIAFCTRNKTLLKIICKGMSGR